MSAVIRQGIARGGIELRHTFTYLPDLAQSLFFAGASALVLFLLRGHHVPGSTFSLGSLTLPSIVGMNVVFSGTLGVVGLLSIEREDGTLLRAKAIPGGMTAYVIGKVTLISATTLIGLIVLLTVGPLAFPVGQVFPMYWIGLGMRSALLPPSLAAVEIDGSWRHWQVLLVLAAWAAAGLIVAPVVLRRMSRRESGSRVAARRERAMTRAT